jgi:hypothetical protein
MILQNEFVTHFLGAENPFREQIFYTASGSTAKTIWGIVTQRGTSKLSGKGMANSVYDVEMLISHDSINGIATVTPNMDKVVFTSAVYGNESNTFLVAGIIDYSPMAWHLGLRA